jgi:hypothetical protein
VQGLRGARSSGTAAGRNCGGGLRWRAGFWGRHGLRTTTTSAKRTGEGYRCSPGGLWWPGLQCRGVVGEVWRQVMAELAEEVVAGRPRAPRSRESMRCHAARLEGGSGRVKGHRRRVIEWAGRLTPGSAVLCSGRSGEEAVARVCAAVVKRDRMQGGRGVLFVGRRW